MASRSSGSIGMAAHRFASRGQAAGCTSDARAISGIGAHAARVA